jgi:anti-sigma factor RsiW
MTHLTDEQFEDVVAGLTAEPAHVAACPECSNRLAEHRALRDRLRSAFATVRPGEALAERIRLAASQADRAAQPTSSRVTASQQSTSQVPAPVAARAAQHHPRRFSHLSRVTWAALTAAAAVFIVSVAVVVHLVTTDAAAAASEELVRIHTDNILGHSEVYANDDPVRLAEYMKTQLGFEPAAPRLGKGMEMRGCCVAHFKGAAVGSYVVKTPGGPIISIIVVPQTPEQLGIDNAFKSGGKTFYCGAFATNNMVTVRFGDYSYCAVGEVSRELLTQILLNLGLGE